jgi:hypothetical protein
MITTTIPVDVTPEAVQRIAELGIQSEVDRMIEHAIKTVHGIRQVVITLEPLNEMYEEPYLSGRAYRDLALWGDKNPEVDEFDDWKIETFSPDVLWRFSLHIRPSAPDAR